MDSKCFAGGLARLAPSEQELEKAGLTPGQIRDFRNSFICREQPRSTNSELPLECDALEGWDFSSVIVGMVRFVERSRELNGSLQVGYVETDPLLLVPMTHEIHVEERDHPGHILWLVALSFSSLLDALLPAADVFAKRAVSTIDFEDTDAARKVAERCTSLAGGNLYRNFYLMLLGAG
jgi:hypothetical protein